MEKHWIVTIQVHEVTPPEPLREPSGFTVKFNVGAGKTAVAMTERTVTERFSITVRADDEAEAYRKAIALLVVNRPDPSEQVEIQSWGSDSPITTRPIRDDPQA